jgi:hypothetical protein
LSLVDDSDEATEFQELGDAHRLDVLRARLEIARGNDDGDPIPRERHVDAACELIVALASELDDDAVDAELAAMMPLVAHDRALELATRRRLATELAEVGDRERALALLEGKELAGDRFEIESEVRRPRVSTGQVPTLAKVPPEMAARLSLASDGDAETNARTAVEHATRANDPALLHAATVALAEALAARDAFAEAEELLEALPPLDESRVEALETRALLEEIWRRLGSHLVDEPDEPDEPGEMDRQLRAYITKPRNFSQALVDGGLASRDFVRSQSHGELRVAADLESQLIFGPVRSFWCACGRYRGRAYAGLVCKRCGVELVHAASRRMRSGHITLAAPVVHPWYAPAAAMLLGVTLQEIEARPVEELRAQLAEIDLEWLADEVKRDIVTAPKAKIADAAGRRFALIEGFRNARKQAYTQPQDIVLDLVAVVPPHGDLGCDREAVRAAYAQVLEATSATTAPAVKRLFDAFASVR